MGQDNRDANRAIMMVLRPMSSNGPPPPLARFIDAGRSCEGCGACEYDQHTAGVLTVAGPRRASRDRVLLRLRRDALTTIAGALS